MKVEVHCIIQIYQNFWLKLHSHLQEFTGTIELLPPHPKLNKNRIIYSFPPKKIYVTASITVLKPYLLYVLTLK